MFPDSHIDLMYLCRRVGLKGGQKAIERELNINVRNDGENLDGAQAVILWHQYTRGDEDALIRLIAYNRADIAAMGAIFDECINRLQVLPTLFEQQVSFHQWSSPAEWQTSNQSRSSWSSLMQERLTFDGLIDAEAVADRRIVGIDLTGSEMRKSGWCLLQGKNCQVASFLENKDLIDRTVQESPDLISIDSPLCLPAGRLSVRDDDPGRERYGIMRECERRAQATWNQRVSVANTKHADVDG